MTTHFLSGRLRTSPSRDYDPHQPHVAFPHVQPFSPEWEAAMELHDQDVVVISANYFETLQRLVRRAVSESFPCDNGLENEILLTVQLSSSPLSQDEIVETLTSHSPNEVKRTIRSLMNRGELRLTIDWKVRAREQSVEREAGNE